MNYVYSLVKSCKKQSIVRISPYHKEQWKSQRWETVTYWLIFQDEI